MKTKTINLYEFSELSEQVKKSVLDKLRYINTEYLEWYDSDFDFWIDKLKEAGFTDAKIFFSGFSSQGDGACFDANIDLSKFTDNARLLRLAEQTPFYISKTRFGNHYSHEKTRYVDFDSIALERQTNIHNALSELCQKIEALRLSISKEIYRDLENTFDGLTSDAAIIETIESNGYTFTENGKLENA